MLKLLPCLLQVCEILCTHGAHSEIGPSVEQLLLTSTYSANCDNQFTLTIGYGVRFANGSVPPRWIQWRTPHRLNYSVYLLKWDMSDVRHISAMSFDTAAFLHTNQLELSNLQPDLRIDPQAFGGMPNVGTLRLHSTHRVEVPNYLASMDRRAEVQAVHFTGEVNRSEQYELQALTGSSLARHVKSLRVRANLRRSLRSDTLRGLTQLSMLLLEDCSIESIAPNALNAMRSTLQLVSLRRNALLTLPTGLMAAILPRRDFVRISLAANRWHCDCELRELQNYMRLYPRVMDGNVLCSSPHQLAGLPVRWAPFCLGEVASAYVLLHCPLELRSLQVGVLGQQVGYRIGLAREAPGSTIQMVNQSTVDPADLRVFVYQLGRQMHKYSSFRSDAIDSSLLKTAEELTPYIVCIFEPNAFSPLDCVTMFGGWHWRDRVWLVYGRQLVAIGVYGVLMFVAFFVGIYAGKFIWRWF